MNEILYERPLSDGPTVRVRRTSGEGAIPVRAVLEVDRRCGVVRPGRKPGFPPSLLELEGANESSVLGELLMYAMEDAELARLMQDRGLR